MAVLKSRCGFEPRSLRQFMNEQIKELQRELERDFEDCNLTFDESEALFSLRNYIDKRFELLEKSLNGNVSEE